MSAVLRWVGWIAWLMAMGIAVCGLVGTLMEVSWTPPMNPWAFVAGIGGLGGLWLVILGEHLR